MSRDRDLRDLAIVMAISGSEDIESPGVQIVEDYFTREAEENRREAGLDVGFQEPTGFTDLEKDIFKRDKSLEELNLARWQHDRDEEEEHLDKEYDVDRMHPYVPLTVIKV